MRARHFAVLSGLVLPAVGVLAQERPFTVDIMMKTEGVAEALFAPDGKRLLLEKTAAYESSQNFAWERAWSRERATLLDIRPGSPPAMRTVSPGDRERVWVSSYSPSGAQAAVGWFDGDTAKAGIYTFATGELRKLDLPISNAMCAFDCPYWLSENSFIHYTLSADEQKKELSDNIYTDELTSRWARLSWTGEKVAVKVLGSGAYQGKSAAAGGKFVLVDTRSGANRMIAEGVVNESMLSPDRRRFAVTMETGSLDLQGRATVIFGSEKILQLAVYDFGQAGARILPCGDCNVTRGSLRWSPSGNKLFFGARVNRDGQLHHEHYIYDFNRRKLERFAPKGLSFEVTEDLRHNIYVTPFAWMDDNTAAVRITDKTVAPRAPKAADEQPKPRYDWYAVPARGAPVKLTGGLAPVKDENPLADYVTARKGRLLMMVDGELWSFSANGQRRNLTQDIAEPLSPWCSAISYWREAGVRQVCSGLRLDFPVRPVDEDALKQGWLTLRVGNGDITTDSLLFLNLDTGKVTRVAEPDADSDLVTASALAQSVVYRRKGADGDRLLLAFTDGKKEELLYFNQQLKGVVGGTPKMLTRREPGENEDRYDWLLLPPGHREGDRHPLLVYFYPDQKYSKEWRSSDLRDVSFLNQQIPAAHGYAVLLASMKISTMEKRGNPMTEMHEQLVRAAENVVQQGYADPQRWAIMGHSYGGYGTACVVTQTDRFKAAVAMDGPMNLTSGYAIGWWTARAMDMPTGLAFGAMWSEGGQGRMGVAPWQDPQRYIQNSPLFSADKITTPLMLIHGNDDFVNVNEAEQMFNALQRQGKDAVFVRYWGEGHVYRSPANIRDMWERIFGWFDEHMDIARDGAGNVIFENHRVKSR